MNKGGWWLFLLALVLSCWGLGAAFWLGGIDAVTAIFRWWA